MTVYVSMDDTDNLNSRGTGRLARAVAAALAREYDVFGVTRHQLYVNEAIPYTSHNSCAVIHLRDAGENNVRSIFGTVREMMLDDFIEGSDPGLAVAAEGRITPSLMAFGKDAKSTVLTQTKARSLAENLGIMLEGLGGTEDGVIGCMAGLGLAHAGNDGRFLQIGGIRSITGPAEATALLAAGIDCIHTLDGRPVLSGTIEAETGKSVKPCPVGGKTVLFVEEIDGRMVAVKRD
ncbi:ABC transporter substrate-binding protein [Methanofollis fontis]|uniref:ABC transporter substrate-binding protein n=1 Tax=Methanofollis fontis TaxID=2052832 RepID=A0A483CQV1_9EURY|nr:ABC transporter substrate-binding protein [Methanofollis fontis]TAJ44551.1 ABC transporter substrate-binding protein [Methanofollis fontis]